MLELGDAQLAEVYRQFSALADRKREILDLRWEQVDLRGGTDAEVAAKDAWKIGDHSHRRALETAASCRTHCRPGTSHRGAFALQTLFRDINVT